MMIKKMQLLFLLLFSIFIPKVYAFEYDLEMRADNLFVSNGEEKEIEVILKNVSGVDGTSGSCSMNVQVFENILLNGEVQTLDNWNITSTENFYVVDTKLSFVSDQKILLIPVKIDGNGDIKLTNIECSSGNDKFKIADKVISFIVSDDEYNEDSETGSDILEDEISIELGEGTLNFDPNVKEYTVTVSDYGNLEVYVRTGYEYIVSKNVLNGKKAVVVTLKLEEEKTEEYIIYVNEILEKTEVESSFNVAKIIFIIIISILVVINIIRIIKRRKK